MCSSTFSGGVHARGRRRHRPSREFFLSLSPSPSLSLFLHLPLSPSLSLTISLSVTTTRAVDASANRRQVRLGSVVGKLHPRRPGLLKPMGPCFHGSPGCRFLTRRLMVAKRERVRDRRRESKRENEREKERERAGVSFRPIPREEANASNSSRRNDLRRFFLDEMTQARYGPTGFGRTRCRMGVLISFDTMYQFNGFRKSTPPQNRHLLVYY